MQKINALFKEAEQDECGLGYDPILMAQDIPSDFQYGKPLITGNSAKLAVYASWGTPESKYVICVSLVKKDDNWRIIDICNKKLEDGCDCPE
jgi:hypothetical protein